MARKAKKVKVIRRISIVLFSLAGLAVVAGLTILLLTYGPLATEEVKYALKSSVSKEIVPIDTEFGIVIPKLGANARVIPDVDPFNSYAYQRALTKGVAHARGTAYPGTNGNVFIFAHSSEDFYNALRYNSIFYLLNKMEIGDTIDMYYHGVKFTYTVTGKKLVAAADISYLSMNPGQSTLTLMTCWPPGTNNERLLIFASL